jgi:hypothetical protein
MQQDDALDLEKVAYFRRRYGVLDDEEIAELAGRRDSLADEAVAALNGLISSRGISVADTAAAATPPPETPLEQQVTLAKELWSGAASRTGQFLCLVAFGSIGGQLSRLLPSFGSSPAAAAAGSLIAALIVVGFSYGGHRFGRRCTREICANADRSIAKRRTHLRWFAVGVVIAFFLVFALLSALLTRR